MEQGVVVETAARPVVTELVPGYPERYGALQVARRFRYERAAEIICSGGCYDEIFAAALEDAGKPVRLVAMLCLVENPKWMYHCALSLPRLTPELLRVLAYGLIRTKNPIWAHWFVQDVPGLSEDIRGRLREIIGS